MEENANWCTVRMGRVYGLRLNFFDFSRPFPPIFLFRKINDTTRGGGIRSPPTPFFSNLPPKDHCRPWVNSDHTHRVACCLIRWIPYSGRRCSPGSARHDSPPSRNCNRSRSPRPGRLQIPRCHHFLRCSTSSTSAGTGPLGEVHRAPHGATADELAFPSGSAEKIMNFTLLYIEKVYKRMVLEMVLEREIGPGLR